MAKANAKESPDTENAVSVSREQLIGLLNEDLSREYQAIIAYVVYSQAIKGAAYMAVARELENHARQELDHALQIAKQIDYLGGDITVTPKPVRTSSKATDMLRFDLANERETIIQYRARVKQCEALGEYAMAEIIRELLKQEQDHLIDLATALGEDPPICPSLRAAGSSPLKVRCAEWSAAALLAAWAPVLGAQAAPAPAERNDIHWFRSSAEYRGIAMEVYRDAADHLPTLTRGVAAGHWAVILDADETVLDNSLHERENADAHLSFTDSGWVRWVRQDAATAIPGAVDFTEKVHRLGGKVVIVTNRADSLCAVTRDNLSHVGVRADLVLCEVAGNADKNPRFSSVVQGTAAPGVPAFNVVEWLGDNIQDFPDLGQAIKDRTGGYTDFGVRYFLLPNPMYGSWEHNSEP